MTNMMDVWPGGATAFAIFTATQGGAGSIVVEISPGSGAGGEFEVLYGSIVYTGTNSITIQVEQTIGQSGNLDTWSNVASVASAIAKFPTYAVLSNSTTESSNDVGWPLRPIISGLMALKITASGAGSGTDTLQVIIYVRVKSASMPVVTLSGTSVPTITAGSTTFVTK